MDVVNFLAIQKEKLDSCLENQSPCCPPIDVNKNIAENEESARKNILDILSEDVLKRCSEYYITTDQKVKSDILYLFGEDNSIDDSKIHEIFLKIKQYDDSIKDSFDPHKEKFSSVKYESLCSACCQMDTFYGDDSLMKKYSVYQNKFNKNKSKLSFTTKHRGFWILIQIDAPCPSCVVNKNSDNPTKVTIKSSPVIENINSHYQLLAADPVQFVERIVYTWIDQHRL